MNDDLACSWAGCGHCSGPVLPSLRPGGGDARGLSSPVCAQVAGMPGAVGRARRQWPGPQLRRPRPTRARPSRVSTAPWRNATKWELLRGLGLQVGLTGNTDRSNSLSSSQLPFQSFEYLKTEGLGAPVTPAHKRPLTLAALPWPRRQPQRLKSLWQRRMGEEFANSALLL